MTYNDKDHVRYNIRLLRARRVRLEERLSAEEEKDISKAIDFTAANSLDVVLSNIRKIMCRAGITAMDDGILRLKHLIRRK